MSQNRTRTRAWVTTSGGTSTGVFAAFQEVIDTAMTDSMTRIGKRCGLRPVNWSLQVAATGDGLRLIGHAGGGDYSETEAVQVVTEWATTLGLTVDTGDLAVSCGLIAYSGVLDGIEVHVWGVADRELFDVETGRVWRSRP